MAAVSARRQARPADRLGRHRRLQGAGTDPPAAQAGCAVTCVLTAGGAQFVTPLSLQALSESEGLHRPVLADRRKRDGPHPALAQRRPGGGRAGHRRPAGEDGGGPGRRPRLTLLLATDKPVLVAPAMNVRMWLHPATQANMATLRARGVRVVGPDEGAMACNEYGPGRLAEPPAILAAIEALLRRAPRPLAGRHALVTSGPTHEPIDPVRYIANRSSGRQGHAIAAALAALGARVTLVSGPVAIADPPGVTVRRVETAARDAGRLPGRAAGRCRGLRRRRRRLARRQRRRAQDEEEPGAAPPTLDTGAQPRHPGHDRRARPAPPAAGRRLRRRNRRPAAQRRRQSARARTADWIVANDVSPARPASWAAPRTRCTWSPPTASSTGRASPKQEVATRLAAAHRRGAGMSIEASVPSRSRRACRTAPDLPLPAYATDGAAGMDLLAAVAAPRRPSRPADAR